MGTDAISPLRQRIIEDMSARQLTPPTQKGHIRACKRFAPEAARDCCCRRHPAVPAAPGRERNDDLSSQRTINGIEACFGNAAALGSGGGDHHQAAEIPLVMGPDGISA
jgi:hypothetical protein